MSASGGPSGDAPAVSVWARRAALLIAALVAGGLVLRLGLIIANADPDPDHPGFLTRLVRLLSYFTIQSNAVVLIAALAVVRGRDLRAPVARAVRVGAVVGITVTGIVFATILIGDMPKGGLPFVASLVLHFVVPPLAVAAFLAVGPWIGLAWGDLGRMLIWPAAWIAWTLIHGAISGWYPYGFVDVEAHGYPMVLGVVAGIVVAASALGLLVIAYDRRRAARSPGQAPAAGAA